MLSQTLSALLCALVAGTQAAVGAPSAVAGPPETEWAVAEVVVRAPAPRLWKLTKGASTVYVLGAVEPLPAGLAWNSAQVSKLMRNANRLILQPYATMGMVAGLGLLVHAYQPLGRSLSQELSPETRSKLEAVLRRLGRSPSSLDKFRAGPAAMELERNLRTFGRLSDAEPLSTLKRLARQNHVEIRTAARYDAGPMMREFIKLPESEGLRLLQQAVDGAAFQLDHANAMGKAWALGDLHALRLNQGPSANLSTLLTSTQAAQGLSRRAEDDLVGALLAALDLPGTSLAVFSLNDLARRGGALEALRARGVEVTEPRE